MYLQGIVMGNMSQTESASHFAFYLNCVWSYGVGLELSRERLQPPMLHFHGITQVAAAKRAS